MANKRLQAIITIGGTVTGAFKNAIGATRTGLGQIGKAITDLKDRQKALNGVIKEQSTLGRSGNALKVQFANQELAVINKQIEALRVKQGLIDRHRQGKAAGAAGMAGTGMVIGAAAAAAATAFVPIRAAAAFEKSMLGIAKQVEGARDGSGQLTQVYHDMARAVQLLGREMPMATNEIADMVAAGARMGVAKDELIDFTRTAGMMASAFDLPAGELAEQMGKIAGLYKIPIPAIAGLADTINYLDDNAISKGGDIIDFLARTGGVAGAVKMTAQEMAALGSTLLTLGERTETASTATNAMLQKLAAADKGSKNFKAAMREIGLSTAAVQKGMQVNAQSTLLKVMEAVNKLPAEKRLGVLVELVGLEHSDTLAKLAGNVAEYRKQIELAGSQEAKGSMGREFAAQLATTSAQWEIAKNRMAEVGVNIGAVLLPAVNKVLGTLGSATVAIADFAREHPALTRNIAAVAGTLTGSLVAWNAVKFGIYAVVWAWNAMKLAMLTNPIGLIAVGLATAAALIYTNWEPLKAWFGELWADIKHTFTQTIDWIIAKIEWVGGKWRSIKTATGGAFGFNGSTMPAEAMLNAFPGPSEPELPAPALANRGGSQYTDNSQTTIAVTQRPGENQEQLAKRLADELERRRAARERATLIDGAYAQ